VHDLIGSAGESMNDTPSRPNEPPLVTASAHDAPPVIQLPPDHPDRALLAGEIHSRPSEALETPARITYVALVVNPEEREAEWQHIASLCEFFSVSPPARDAIHFATDLAPIRLKWERHSEFSGYTFVARRASPTLFSDPPIRTLPKGWLASAPGRTLFAAHASLVPAAAAEPDAQFLVEHFGDQLVVGAEIGGGAGYAFTDLQVHPDGFERFVILNRCFTVRQSGRMVQRLFEIEAYRMMALLALPLVRPVAAEITANEQALTALTSALATGGADDKALLQRLTRLAAEVQGTVTRTQFRFSACRAYNELVKARIAELRERRLAGSQPLTEFMSRRFSPAVATCANTAQRLRELADRVGQASALLSTRVDIVREQQNQRLLESMNIRAERQFRLQQAVEGLSVAAIVYYGAGLVGYLAKALKRARGCDRSGNHGRTCHPGDRRDLFLGTGPCTSPAGPAGQPAQCCRPRLRMCAFQGPA
jgi:uncharacterized membrane-anchored protein